MPLWTRITVLLAALALGVLAAGCGGGDDQSAPDVPADAVAVVGGRPIPKSDYERLLAQAEATYKQRKQDFPVAGTPEYAALRTAIVKSLVEQTEFEIGAEELDVEVTDEEVEKELDNLKQQFFQGDEDAYLAELKKQGLTEEQVKNDIRNTRLLPQKVFEAVTKDVKVTDQEIQEFYDQNKAQFEQPASREVRHILVKTKAKAEMIHRQLENGASFAQLAKRYSQDPSSKNTGGKFTAQQGTLVAPFETAAFGLETGELSGPIKTQFGWHIIEALGDTTPKSSQPLADVKQQINQQLLEQNKNKKFNTWFKELTARLRPEIAYAPGFQPAKTQTGPTTGDGTGTDAGITNG
jgi:parvulin-like peptidyl-prolyl isomerase